MTERTEVITHEGNTLTIKFPVEWFLNEIPDDPTGKPTWAVQDEENKVNVFLITWTPKGFHLINMLQSQVSYTRKKRTLTITRRKDPINIDHSTRVQSFYHRLRFRKSSN